MPRQWEHLRTWNLPNLPTPQEDKSGKTRPWVETLPDEPVELLPPGGSVLCFQAKGPRKKWASWLLDFQIKMYKFDIDLETLDMFLKILEISMTSRLPPGTNPLPPRLSFIWFWVRVPVPPALLYCPVSTRHWCCRIRAHMDSLLGGTHN